MSAKRHFYFSRTSPPPVEGKYVVSGVIEADDVEAAIGAFNAAIKTAGAHEDAQHFDFRALAAAPRDANGLIAVTMAEEV